MPTRLSVTAVTLNMALAALAACGPSSGHHDPDSADALDDGELDAPDVAGDTTADLSELAEDTRGDLPDPFEETGCDPLVPSHCGFPFPSSLWLIDDPTTVTGRRVRFTRTNLPAQNTSGRTDPASWDDCDGFSPAMSLLTHLPGATIAGLPDENHLALSVTVDSPTIVLDTRTGELVPHIAELDMTAASDDERTFIIRPVVRLADATRYVVAIRRVRDTTGAPLPASPAFAALRDGVPYPDRSIERRRALYEDIFADLDAAGIQRTDLQLAWDFWTASREVNTRWMLAMRDEALALVGTDGPEYEIDAVEENPNPFILRRIHGRFRVPLYLESTEPDARMVFDDQGLPRQNGWGWYPFLVHVPHSATSTPGAILQNGHGLFGSMDEGQDGYLAEFAQEHGFVAIAVDMVGFASGDWGGVVDSMTGDLGHFRGVVERQHQGMLNSLLAMRLAAGRLGRDPALTFDGHSVIDPTRRYYRGDSQGGIMGATYMALSTDVERGLLGEPGSPYSFMLSRSVDFDSYFALAGLVTPTAFDVQIGMGLIQMLWDRIEPSGYAPYIARDPLPGTAPHEVLLHVAIGDHQVSPLTAHLLARTIGVRNLRPTNRGVWGIPEADGPFVGSGMVEYDFGLPPAPTTNVPMRAGDDPHDEVRKLSESMAQTAHFFATGEVRNFCDGSCDPR